MTKENAVQYFNRGKQLLQAKNMLEALKYFSQAIKHDPDYTEAYQYRGHILSKLGRIDEAKEDLARYQSRQAQNTDQPPHKEKTKVQRMKMDLRSVDNIYDTLAAGNGDELDFEDDVYDYAFSDDTLESDSLLDSLIAADEDEQGIPAILEYINGQREEVPQTYPFEPTEEELTLVTNQEPEGRIISFDQLRCIRLARPPKGFPRNKDLNCHVEIIETVDGSIFHEAIAPEQNRKHVLFGFSTKEDTHFTYTLMPLVNIKKRFQRRHLGQILLDKKLLTDLALKNALDEHNELKKIKFGKILAEHANLLQSAVEAEIQKAFARSKQNQKIGEILLRAGLVNEEQIEQALKLQKKLHNRKLGNFLIDKGILQEKDVYMALAEKFRIPFVDLRHQKGSKKAVAMLPEELIRKLVILPLAIKGDTLVIATMMPDPAPICDVIIKHSPLKNLDFVLVQPSHLRNVINLLFHKNEPAHPAG